MAWTNLETRNRRCHQTNKRLEQFQSAAMPSSDVFTHPTTSSSLFSIDVASASTMEFGFPKDETHRKLQQDTKLYSEALHNWHFTTDYWGNRFEDEMSKACNTTRWIAQFVRLRTIDRKSRACPHHEGVERKGIASLILNIGTRWRWVVNFTHPPLYPQGWTPLGLRTD